MSTILEVKNIAKRYGKVVVLVDIDFKIKEGEFVYITGASGAGKTTLLKCILRQTLPDAGEIILEGEDIAKLPRKKVPKIRQKIGVVFQDFKVLPERTVSENVEVALAVLGLPKSEWDSRVEHVLRLVGLFDRANLFPSQLSGGELQRVTLARALVVNPKIILADEPTGNLDWETADKMIELFNLINREGKTILMATHNMQIIEKHKRRVIEIKNGLVFKDTGVEGKEDADVGSKFKTEAIDESVNDKVEENADQNPTNASNSEESGVPNIHPAEDIPVPANDKSESDSDFELSGEEQKNTKDKHNKKKKTKISG